jgi:hypothetical protein
LVWRKGEYNVPSPEKQKIIYMQYMPFLIIEKELDVSESPEYQKIKQDNRILQAETARHVVERSELQDLRAEIEKLKAEKRDMVDAHWVTVAENDKKNNLLNTITSKR